MTARSYLFVPGDQPHKLEQAAQSGADAVIADLEDAVAPLAKAAARRTVANWLATQTSNGHAEIWVRVNSSRLIAEDVHALVAPALTGLCLPKVHSPEQVRRVDDMVAASEQPAGLATGSIRLLPLLESAAGILSARATAEAPRVVQLGFGELNLWGTGDRTISRGVRAAADTPADRAGLGRCPA